MLYLVTAKVKLILITLFLFSITFSARSENIQQKNFLSAEKLLWKTGSNRYQALYKKLHYYPLQPYLDQQRLMSNISLSSVRPIHQFLTQYEGTPMDWPLRKKWLAYLAKRKRQSLFVKFFKPTNNAALNCHYFNFQLALGEPEDKVLPQVTKLWRIGKSQSKVCDSLFNKWQKAGYQTEDVIWQRIALAADGGKHTLLPYLTKLLPKKEQYLGQLWLKVRRDPAYIKNLGRFPEKSIRETQILTYGLKRLIWRDPAKALTTFKKAENTFPFTKQQKQQIKLKFAIALASKNNSAAQYWLEQVDEEQLDGNLIQWRIADILREQNWSKINVALNDLPKIVHSKLQWQYWYGRSLIHTNNEANGKLMLTKLANERHYYGFLAASFIEQPYNLQDKPLMFSEEEKSLLLENPAAKRAFEFFHLKRYHEARKEWNYWLSQLNDHQKLMASKIANEVQWYDRAIFTLSNVGYLDDVDLRFPLAFDDEINHYANNHNIDPAWAFAITRRESSFMSDAHSSAGAKGLMQVMPNTAKYLKKKSIATKYLLNAKNNINLGTQYLKKLLDRYQGNAVLATASYNAGPYRVKSWLKGKAKLPADMWIETIPYKETRDYVKSVLAYQQIYQHKAGKTKSLFDEIIKMEISE
jgi:soluble lytic murein transglycosylase